MRLITKLDHLRGRALTIGRLRVQVDSDGGVEVDTQTAAYMLKNMPHEWVTEDAAKTAAPTPRAAVAGTAFDGPAPNLPPQPDGSFVARDILGRERDPNVPVATQEAWDAAQKGAQASPGPSSPPPPPPPPSGPQAPQAPTSPAPASASNVPTPPGHTPSGPASGSGSPTPPPPPPPSPAGSVASTGEGLRAQLNKMPEAQLRQQLVEASVTAPEGADKSALVEALASAAEQQARS